MAFPWPRRLAHALSELIKRRNGGKQARRINPWVELLEDRVTPSTLIAVANHRDLVFDSSRDLLYITTSAGTVQQYSIATQTLLSPLNVGTSLNGADISADGSALYVAENQAGSTQGVIHKVNLATDAVTDLPYSLGSYEGGAWDVALDANGRGLATTSFNGSGWVPLRQVDLATDTLAIRTDAPGSGGNGQVFGKSLVHRSADRSTFLITESNISSGPLFTYNATTNTFSSSINTNAYLDHLSAISRNGSLIAYEKYGAGLIVLDHNFNTITTLSGIDGGVAFDPLQDTLYGVNSSTGQVVAYDTNTWSVKFQMAIGESVTTAATFGNGVMTVSNDGSMLFLATPSGVRLFNLPAAPVASQFLVSGFASPATAGTAGSFTVSAVNSAGSTATGYIGTVHFTSSDVNAQTPADYTFTTADQGVHTFNATLTTAGTQSLTATDTAQASVTGSQTGIAVNAAAATQLVVSGPAGSTAGATFYVTVRALDAYGNQAAGYTGTVHFSSSDTQAGLPADCIFSAANGGALSFAVVLKTAGVQSLTVADTAAPGLTSTLGSVTVSPTVASRLGVGGFPSPITAGVAGTFTVTALDAYGNVATGYTGTVRFSTGSQGTLPANYTFTTGDQGIHSFSATLRTAGSFGLLAVDVSNSSVTGSETGIVVNGGAVSGLRIYTLSANSYPAHPGRATDVTVAGVDAYGNASPGYTGTVHFSSSDGAATLPADYTFTAVDNGSHTFTNGVTLQTVGSQTITATDNANSAFNATLSISVVSPVPAGFHLGLTASVSATTAGTPFSFTVTALDGNNNVVTNYGGAVTIYCVTGHSQLPYAPYTFTSADSGVHTFTNAALYTAGNQVINAYDQAVSPGGGAGSVTVAVTPAPANLLTLGGFPATTTAGSTGTVTVTAWDMYGNVATGYTGTIHFGSSDGQAALPTDMTLSTGAGIFNATLKTAGTQSLTVRDTANGALTATENNIHVNPGAASTLVFTGYPITTTAGSASTFLLCARDAYGNLASSYTGTVHFSSSDPQAVLPGTGTFSNGTGNFSATFKTAGTQSFSVTDSSNSALTASHTGIAVNPAAASTLVVTGFPATAIAGAAGTFTVTAKDAFGNVASGYTGTVHFSSSDAQAVLPATATLSNGTATFSATFKTAGIQTLSATDTVTGSIAGTQPGIGVIPATATTLTSTGFPAAITAGAAGTYTVTARDSFGNVATGYTGTVHFSSSDAQAALPANYSFNAGDAGVHAFNVTLKTAGNQSLTVAETATTGLNVTQSGILVGAAAPSWLNLTGLPTATTAGAPVSFSVFAMDPYGNVATSYTGTVSFSSSDAQAVLPASYTFLGSDQGMRSFTATFKTGGTQHLVVQDIQGAVYATQMPIQVNAGAATILGPGLFPTQIAAGSNGTFTVVAGDAYGNIATGYTGTVTFSSSDAQAGLPTSYTFTAGDQGKHTFTATLKTAGVQSLTVRDTANGLSGNKTGILVSAAAASNFVVAGYVASTTAGTAHTFTVTAKDAYGNLATGYTSTVTFSSSDAKAGLPASYTFTAGDHGTHTFTATLKTAGTQSLTVKDSSTPGIAGNQTNITVTPAAVTSFLVSAPASARTGVAFNVTVTAVDAFGNIVPGYRGKVHFLSSDRKAGLPADYIFTSGDNGAHTFSVIFKTLGSQTLTVTDSVNSSITRTVTVGVTN